MVRPYSIALLYGGEISRKYAETMKEVILEESVFYPYIPVMVSPGYWQEKGRNGAKVADIMRELEKCDYVYLFLSAFYEGNDIWGADKSSKRHIPKLNPIFEYGYLLNSLGDEKITIIPDFPYRDIENGSFVFLSDKSDLLTSHRYEITENMKKDGAALKNAFKKWFSSDMKVQGVLPQSSMSKFDELVFRCNNYTLDYVELFEQESDLLEKYKLSEQIETVLDRWNSEISEFDELDKEMCFSYKTLFCYERLLLYLAIQKKDASWIDRLYFNATDIDYTQEQLTIIQIYNSICDYIQTMGARKKEKNGNYFKDQASYLSERLVTLPNTTNPLITTIVHNYIGLCYWNYYCLLPEDVKKRQRSYLDSAEKEFTIVIEACEKGIRTALQEGRNTHVILSYVYFNLARVSQARGDDIDNWQRYFEKAIVYRQQLSVKEGFPEFIQLHFLKEYFWAKTTFYDQVLPLWKQQGLKDQMKSAYENLSDIRKTINSYEQVYLEEKANPFFKDIKEKVEKIGALFENP